MFRKGMFRHPANSVSFIVLFLLLLTGCQTTQEPISTQFSGRLNDPIYTRTALTKQYSEWKGVPYRNGGTTKKGVDCSSFIQQTFSDQFSINLPRDTINQAQVGFQIPTNHLRPGDLVFFNTGYGVRHVGVMLDQRNFIHASTSKGVMISDLNQSYWQRTFWQARRL